MTLRETMHRDPAACPRVGVWLIGARGSVATTVAVGLRALAAGHVAPHGLVSSGPALAGVPLADFGDIDFGGHDISSVSLVDRARLLADGGMFRGSLVDAVADGLREDDEQLRQVPRATATQQEAIDAMAADIVAFRARRGLRTVVVVDVSSTEQLPADRPEFHDERLLEIALNSRDDRVLPPSSVAAAAAIQAGSPYACFTPSTGLALPVLRRRAARAGIPFAGQDGKTGETLLRTVLAPMFAFRQLKVLSWAGTNLLGGGDGATLADPEAVRSKLVSKNRGLHALVGDDVVAPLHIDNVPDFGDVKTAWDNVHAVGFLDTRISLQTTWTAYDSTLAAPLVIDLVRLLARAAELGQSGEVPALSSFFKDPWGSDVHAFAEQSAMLEAWARDAARDDVDVARVGPGEEAWDACEAGVHESAGSR